MLLFYNNRSYDDRPCAASSTASTATASQVFVDAHWIKSVGRYQAITRGVSVDQSPTVVVADRNLKAETLVGYVDAKTIDQAVVDALRASGGSRSRIPTSASSTPICVSAKQQQSRRSRSPPSAAAVPAYLAGLHAISVDGDAKVRGVKPPKKHATFAQGLQPRRASTNTAIVANAMNAGEGEAGALGEHRPGGRSQEQPRREEVRRAARRARPQLLLGPLPTLGA